MALANSDNTSSQILDDIAFALCDAGHSEDDLGWVLSITIYRIAPRNVKIVETG